GAPVRRPPPRHSPGRGTGMEQLLTRPLIHGLDTETLAARLLRCAVIEEAVARALETWVPRVSDPPLPATLAGHRLQDERHAHDLRAHARSLGDRDSNGDPARDPDLRHWLTQLPRARDTVELLAGIYGVLKPVLADAYRDLAVLADAERDRD